MKLTSVAIANFRSIREEITLPIKTIGGAACYMLLGINESGKSTLLDAIALLNGEEDLDYELDCNKQAQDQSERIEITYALDIEDPEPYKQELISLGVDEALVAKIKFTDLNRFVFLEEDDSREDLYGISIKEDKTFDKYVFVKNEEDKIIQLRTPENEVRTTEGVVNNVLTKQSLEIYIEDILSDFLDENLPEIIFWRPSEDRYLINKSIDLNLFKDKPEDVSIPLRNCFRIAGIDTSAKIKSRIEAIAGKASKIEELEQLLSETVTSHINEIWGEHDVGVKFNIDNMQLSFLIEDKDNNRPKYGISQRSDGFRHFVSILLNLSAENKTDALSGKIILLDEPETHLHPSGQKYLRDELLSIAKKNIVFFATHSVYMVDTKNIDRHYSIKKQEGRTIVSPIEKDNPYREEVLFEALGTSVLELIEPKVLIFEGKTDRDIFELYTRKFKTDLKPPKISLISADGCNNIQKYTKFFNTKIVGGYVIVDSDDEGVQQKNLVLKEEGYNSKNTFEINDILNTKKESTLEDLFDKKYLIEAVKEYYGLDVELDEKVPLIGQLKQKLQQNRKPYREEDKQSLKHNFFEKISKLKKEDLEKELYYGFCEKLCSKIKAS